MTSKRKQAGVLSIDAAMALLVLAVLISLASVWIIKQIDAQDFKIAADKQRTVAEALSKYLKDNFHTVLAAATATQPVQITVPMLRNTNYLPQGFTDTNGFGQVVIGLARKPNPNQLEAIVLTQGGQAISELGIRTIAESLGGPGGYVSSNNTSIIQGVRGGWQLALSNYAASPGPGHTASALFLMDGVLANDYLYRNAVPGRPELNTMNTSLNMGGNDITNSGTIIGQAVITGTLKVQGLTEEGALCTEVGLIASSAGGKLLGCDGERWGKATDMPNAHRYLFTTSTEWPVPKGVKSALVTMAGGGASGLGWRVSSNLETGSSGGYVFSAPVNLTEGETLSIIVGKGAISYMPYVTSIPSQDPRYPVIAPPSNDDGLGGYPGSATKIVSASAGILLECAGGSGAAMAGVDSYAGDFVPGGLPGATSGSGYPSYPSPSRPADGPFVTPGGPGACGLDGYGIGNKGTAKWGLAAGDTSGGMTPLGYGSGGSVSVTGCYVTVTDMSYCVHPQPGRDGVVMIDVLY